MHRREWVDLCYEEVSQIIGAIVRKNQELDTRVQNQELWSQRATQEFLRLSENSERMYQDILNLGNGFNSLHDNLKKYE